MTWKEAVGKVAKAKPHEMLAVAGKAALEVSEADRHQAVVRALMREAHVVERAEVRRTEVTATKGTPGRARAEFARISNEIKKSVGPILSQLREELRLEWTEELLESRFTLRDGLSVTWGAATVAQHKERADMFMDNVAANMDGAARHNKAIRAIEEAGAKCLNEAVDGVAA
jgi:hypothetical protein